MNQKDKQQPDNESSSLSQITKLLEVELSEITNSFRWLASALLNVATVLAVVNITLVGYATSNSIAGIFLLGAGVTALLLSALRAGITGAVPLLCRLVAIEDEVEQILNRNLDTTISMTLLSILGPDFSDKTRAINKILDISEKRKAMKQLERELFLTGTLGTWVLLFTILAQLVFIPILIYFFHWKFL